MDHSQYIIDKLEEARDERGMPIAELARRSGIHRKRLWYILNGERKLRGAFGEVRRSGRRGKRRASEPVRAPRARARGEPKRSGIRKRIEHQSLILAQDERWRRA